MLQHAASPFHRSLIAVHHVDVRSVTIAPTGAACPFATSTFADFGSRLTITLPQAVGSGGEAEVTVKFHAGSGPAFVWLKPEQTTGKVLPYLFTQGQACLNRSVFPCQDTPASRCTWTGCILAPDGFSALLSGPRAEGTRVEGDRVVGEAPTAAEEALIAEVSRGAKYAAFRYAMTQPVPVYLIAACVGDLRCARVGPRSHVWTEPPSIAAAAWEFGHDDVTERYIATAERLFGPYRWQYQDIVVMVSTGKGRGEGACSSTVLWRVVPSRPCSPPVSRLAAWRTRLPPL